MQTAEKQQVIDAINALGRRVTAADVASKTGLPLHVANSELNKVAAEANGHLEVSTTGDIAYKFSPGFESVYFATGIKKVFETVTKKVIEILFFLLRISFGVMLILTFIAIILLILVAVIALSRMGSDDDSGPNFDFDFLDFMILRDLFYWGSWRATDPYYDYDSPSFRRPQEKKGNFFFNVFSFLFGDGDPNDHLDERKWQMIAEVIRNNQGVVTAEQLSPYTGADPKNEDAVLPVLVRYDGKPEVTETGNIVYVFPNMQVRGGTSSFKAGSVPSYLHEYPWKFTNVPSGELTPVYILATVNFFGSWWLMFESAMLRGFIPLIIGLSVYGTAFLLVPLIRYLVLQWKNNDIESRNKKREDFALMMRNPSAELSAKRQEAASYSIKTRIVDEDSLAYTTEKDNLEQEFSDAISVHDNLSKLQNQYLKRAAESQKAKPKDDSVPRIQNQKQPGYDNVINIKDKEKHPNRPLNKDNKNSENEQELD